MAARPHPARIILGALLTAAALLFAYCSWDDAHYAYLRGSNASAAHAARPNEAVSLGKFIDGKLQREPGLPVSDAEAAAARTAMIGAPLSRALLRIVALKAEMGRDLARADKAMGLSNAISRRDALTQLWLIERSVSKDDMKSALQHYHAALSVHPELRPALFSVLAKAIAFPEVRTALAPYLARQSPWSPGMLNTALIKGNPVDVAQLVIPIGDMVRGEVYEAINARLIGRLVAVGEFALADKLSQATVPGLDRTSLDTLAVNDITSDSRLGALAWKFADDGQIIASPNGLGGFDIDVDPLASGNVAMRTVPIVGGRTYLFGQTLHGNSGPGATAVRLTWRVFCLPSETRKLIWQEALPNVRQTKRFEGVILVPADCKGLEFVLAVRGPEGQEPAHAIFEALDLKTRPN